MILILYENERKNLISKGHEDIVTLLVEQRADVNACNSRGLAPCDEVREYGEMTTKLILFKVHIKFYWIFFLF